LNPKYEQAKKELEGVGRTRIKVFGNSMTPIIKSGAQLIFESFAEYEKGDIVFCKVQGRYIDAHKITAKNNKKGYKISNNHGWDNGWTKTIYGSVVEIDGKPYGSRKRK